MARKDLSGQLPLTAAERQVVLTLKATEGVAAEIEALRRDLRQDTLPAGRRAALQGKLLEALDRMTNLLGVMSTGLADDVSKGFRENLQNGIADLRERVFLASVQVLESRLTSISDEAGEVLAGRAFYRLGLGDRMRETLAHLAFTIEGLGGRDGLPNSLKSCLAFTEQAVANMQAFETRTQLLPEFA